MIIQLSGKVKFPLTLDASVWIFDDRKILFEEAFEEREVEAEVDELKKAAERFNLELYQQKIKPPVNKSINKYEREKILYNTYVMPIKDFINNAEVSEDVVSVTLKTTEDDIIISPEQLKNSLFLFSIDGKPVKESGPVHIYFGDGSNKDDPIKGVNKITFN